MKGVYILFVYGVMKIIYLILINIFVQLMVNVNVVNGSCRLIESNISRSSMGRRFFHNLISNNESLFYINEYNICSLIHFLIEESDQNGQSVEFSSG